MRIMAWTCMIGLMAAGVARGAPYLPSSDDEVVETLPTSFGDAGLREFRPLKRQLDQNPRDVALATNLASRYVAHARASADPRYYGYAESALEPWWDEDEPPTEVLRLRAAIRQFSHDFEPALKDLDLVIKRQGSDGEAQLTKSTILFVMGRYDESERACRGLGKLIAPLTEAVCTHMTRSLRGQAKESYEAIKTELARAGRIPPEVSSWAYAQLAEIAVRLGEPKAAELHFLQAITRQPNNSFALAAYADFLIAQSRPDAALRLLAGKQDDDNLVLRLALAAKATGSPDAEKFISMLDERFRAAEERGTPTHQREEAIFRLKLKNDPRQALALARINWKHQREPIDAKIYLETAVAQADLAAKAEVVRWLKSQRVVDPQFDKYLAKTSQEGEKQP